MEGDELYRELQRALDHMPVPYPATESGVELRILKHLFTPEEARVALHLSAIPEPLKTIFRRGGHGMSREQLGEVLDRTAEITSSILSAVARRAIVYSSGFELHQGLIQDTNSPFIRSTLEKQMEINQKLIIDATLAASRKREGP